MSSRETDVWLTVVPKVGWAGLVVPMVPEAMTPSGKVVALCAETELAAIASARAAEEAKRCMITRSMGYRAFFCKGMQYKKSVS